MKKKKPIKGSLQFYKTGKIEHFNSVVEFCRNHPELGENAKFHFTPVFKGKQFHYKGWHLPWTKPPIKLLDVNGNEYIVKNPLLFCKTYVKNQGRFHGIHITKLLKLINGEIKIYKGLYLKGSDAKFKRTVTFKATFKKGNKIFSGKNVSELARQLNKDRGSLYGLTSGARDKTRDGIRLIKVEQQFDKKKKFIKKN